ncbi:MAG: hypothetical protein J6S61_04530 [Elusimicrobiaceae bacterium]|nr:hypothetical protein [Elusimicrobiaceae bacterium]
MRKKLSIALLAFSLAMLCANFLVRRVGSFLPPPAQETEEENDFSPFALVKQEDNKEYSIEDMIDPTDLILQQRTETYPASSEKEIVRPVLKVKLTREEEQLVGTYSKNPKMQEFIKEISTVVSQEELEQENYLQIVYKPEVRSIFEKYSKDEGFREIALEVMKNKYLLQLAQKLVNDSEVKK